MAYIVSRNNRFYVVPMKPDTDGDGLSDDEEIYEADGWAGARGTLKTVLDTDGDGILDVLESNIDTDGDGLSPATGDDDETDACVPNNGRYSVRREEKKLTRLAVISEETVRQIITRQLAFDAARATFEAVAVGRSQVFDVVIDTGLNHGEAFAIKSGIDFENERVGFKCGTYWADNGAKGLPSHGSTILLLDPATGFPQVLVNASYLNGFRTAAADAVAVSSLARSDAAVLGVIGAGHQAEQEIRAVAEVRKLSSIKIFTPSEARASWIASRLNDIDIDLRFTSAEDAVRGSDIVVTVTPSESPLVRDEWVGDGTHISAMGADDRGKHELDTEILKRASLFADYPKQSVVIGEFQHAYNAGLIKQLDEICALGLVTLGESPGRVSDSQITVFDSSGIAIQDLTVAGAIFAAAQQIDKVQYVDF